MQFSKSVEEYTTDNQTWLGSRHGTHTARTVTIKGSALAEFEGFVPSGIPLKRDEDGKYSPVAAADDVLAGFLLTSQKFDGVGDVVAPLIERGRVRVGRLPEQAFDVSTLTAVNPLFVLQED